jgi:mannose-6-phosphate isomerase-like protein (cupin superfamily)
MIYQLPGETNRAHWHPDFDEWWVVLKGRLEWKIGDVAPFQVGRRDIVFAPAGLKHVIRTIGSEPSARLAVTIPGPRHVFTDPA